MSDNLMFGDGQSADWWNRIKESYPNHRPTYEPSDVQWEVARQMNCDWVRLRNMEITMMQLRADLSASRAECERLRVDSERLEWLAQQNVSVRIPLRYGSHHCFDHYAEPDEGEEIDVEATDNIRRSIDQARTALEAK